VSAPSAHRADAEFVAGRTLRSLPEELKSARRFADLPTGQRIFVHPSPAGSQFFAEAIWKAMKARCILTP
jgi:hypothetical protein